MLISSARYEPAPRHPSDNDAGSVSCDAVTSERARCHREAELRAHVGTFEITVGLDGARKGEHWSAGINAILGRASQSPPLMRNAYVLQYIHPEDQKLVTGLSNDALAHGRNVEMTYRIVREDGAICAVTEQLSVVATTPTERLLFGHLKQILQSEVSDTSQTEPTTGPMTLQGLIVTFDALKEREQRRLAREMHDDFGQLLGAMKLDLCILGKKIAHRDAGVVQQVENLQELVDTMISSTRRIIAELPPKAIDDLGLCAALEQLVSGFQKRYPLSLVTRMTAAPFSVDPDVALATYRILQEALNNIVRHAGATKVSVDVECNSTELVMRVVDDGKGAAVNDLRKSESFGLAWMRERVVALAGTIAIDSVECQGTTIAITLPLPVNTHTGDA